MKFQDGTRSKQSEHACWMDRLKLGWMSWDTAAYCLWIDRVVKSCTVVVRADTDKGDDTEHSRMAYYGICSIGAELLCVGDTLTTWGNAVQCRALTDRCLLSKVIRNPIGCIRSETLGEKKGIFGYSRRWKKAHFKWTPCLGNSTLPRRILSSWTGQKTKNNEEKTGKYDGNQRGVGNAEEELGGYFWDGRLKHLDGWIMPWRALEKNSESWSRDLLCKKKNSPLIAYIPIKARTANTHGLRVVRIRGDRHCWRCSDTGSRYEGRMLFRPIPRHGRNLKKNHVCRFPDFPDVEHLEICEGRSTQQLCPTRTALSVWALMVRCRSVMSSWQEVLEGVYDWLHWQGMCASMLREG